MCIFYVYQKTSSQHGTRRHTRRSQLTIVVLHTISQSGLNPFTKPGWTKNVKTLQLEERRLRRMSVLKGRPREMQFQSFREYKHTKRKRVFRNALNTEHDKYLQSVYREIDEPAELDLRQFWRRVKQRRPRSSRIYPEICNKHGTNQTDPEGVAGAFADFYEDTYRFFRIRTLMLLLRRIFPIVNPTLKTNTRHWTKLYIII